MSFRKFTVMIVTLCSVVACGPKSKETANDAPVPTSGLRSEGLEGPEADAVINRYLKERFAQPERRKWRIEYRKVYGLADESEYKWYVAGTNWWVRGYPEIFSFDSEATMGSVDRKAVHEIDAVALGQNYGVIDFYIFEYPKKIR